MALTAAQIVTLACQIAKTQGMTAQAGQKLNAILQELCQTYDLSAARLTTTFNFTGSSRATSSRSFKACTRCCSIPSLPAGTSTAM